MIVQARLDRARIGTGRPHSRAAKNQARETGAYARRRHQCTDSCVGDPEGGAGGGASARPPTSSLKVFSSTSNPVLPSQLEPVGKVLSTSRDWESTSSTPPWPPVMGTGTARGECA